MSSAQSVNIGGIWRTTLSAAMQERNVLHVGICFLEMILAAIWMQNIRVLNVCFVHGMGFYQNFQNISVATLLADTLVETLLVVDDRASPDAGDGSVAELARPGCRHAFVTCPLALTVLLLEPSHWRVLPTLEGRQESRGGRRELLLRACLARTAHGSRTLLAQATHPTGRGGRTS